MTADGGASLSLAGVSLTTGVGPAPIVGQHRRTRCASTRHRHGTFTGKIVVCQRGGDPAGRVQKGFNVQAGGAVGMILYNPSAAITDQETDNHFLPVSHIQFSQGAGAAGLHRRAIPDVMATITRRRQGHPAGRCHGVVQLARWPGPVARRQQA